MSRFEVRKDGKTMQQGDESQLPDAEVRKQMRNAGYKIYVDGKVYRK